MTYSIIQEENVTHILIDSNTKWGVICFAWENTNVDFVTALNSKGIDAFIELLIQDPNTAYLTFIAP
jgi:hypothetical protein